jgi:ribosomal-protein-serine acetyltransferase
MAAIAASLTELQLWMPWAQTMPDREVELGVLREGEAAFDADREWQYTLFESSSGQLVGGAGLHYRVGTNVLEVGYWVRSDRTRRGYATAAARALVNAAFTYLPHSERIEIQMDVANLASAAIPPKLGFELLREQDREILAKGHTGRGFVWVLDRPQ